MQRTTSEKYNANAEKWRDVAIPPDSTIRKALELIERGGVQIALVVNPDDKLLGTLTDGDVRRALIKGASLDSGISDIFNPNPIHAKSGDQPSAINALMRSKSVLQVPVLDDAGRVLRLVTLTEMIGSLTRPSPVVIMAGGLGSRLRPLTETCPKPLLRIGGKPILEILMECLVDQGFQEFHFSINYLGHMIENYFGDGSRFGVNIGYLKEDKPLGTAGALGLFKKRPEHPLLVMNGDLLTMLDFGRLMDHHEASGASGTLCVREHALQVPFGVVRVKEEKLMGIEEKPVTNYLINAGIYVLDPKVLDMVAPQAHLDMTTLFERLIACGHSPGVYVVRDYWLDVGRPSDYEKANNEFSNRC